MIIEAFLHRGIAQLVEQRSPKPRVQGPSPCAPASEKNGLNAGFKPFFLVFSSSAHGLFFRDFERQIGVNFVSGGNRS